MIGRQCVRTLRAATPGDLTKRTYCTSNVLQARRARQGPLGTVTGRESKWGWGDVSDMTARRGRREEAVGAKPAWDSPQ